MQLVREVLPDTAKVAPASWKRLVMCTHENTALIHEMAL